MKTPLRCFAGVGLLLSLSLAAFGEAPRKEVRIAFGDKTIPADEVVTALEVTCGQVRVAGVVDGTAQVTAGNLFVDGAVNGRVKATCANVEISGGVGEGGVEARFGNVTVTGTVRGPITVTAGNVVLRGNGKVEGRILIHGGRFQGDRSRVSGGVVLDDKTHLGGEVGIGEDKEKALGPLLALLFGLGFLALGWWLLAIFLAGLVFYLLLALLFRGTLEKRRLLFPEENLGLDFLAGAMAIGAGLVLSVCLCLSCVGIPLLSFVVLAYVAAYWFGTVTLGYVLGRAVWSQVFRKPAGFFGTVLVGLATLQVMKLIPFVGAALGLICYVLAIGMTVRWVLEARRSKPPSAVPPVVQPPTA